jgi:AcrR family transcriptional regulator
MEVSDGRLARGARSRQEILRRAVDQASFDGLHGLSFARLATETGLSKGGIQTLFGTKERLQLATAEYARQLFQDAVIEPALAEPPGVARLRALVERWITYVQAPLFPGGCFWGANLAEFDSRPGPIRDALDQHQRSWRRLLAAQFKHAVEAEQIALLDFESAAFQLQAVLLAANTALRFGDSTAPGIVRRLLDDLLVSSRPGSRSSGRRGAR